MTKPLYPISRATVEKLSWLKGEPAWLTEMRLKAWAVYEEAPHKEVAGFSLDQIHALTEAPRNTIPSHQWPRDLQHALDERGDEEGLIVHRDSTVLSKAITKESTKKGVIFTDLETAVKTVPELVKRYLGSQVAPTDAWTALNAAFWSGGSFLYVPAHTDLLLPFHSLYWLSNPSAAIFSHTLIIAEVGSNVSFVDEYLSGNIPGLSVGVAELIAREKSHLHYYALQNWGRQVHHESRRAAEVSGSGELLSLNVTMGAQAKAVSMDLEILCQGQRMASQASAGALEREAIEAKMAQGLTESEATFETAGAFFAPVLNQVPHDSLREKIRHYAIGKVTGERRETTLHRTSQLHPEIRA